MNEIAHSVTGGELKSADGVERRILRSMIVTVSVAVLLSAVLAPWRVTTGLLLGGTLSLLNFHWLHGSVATLLNMQETGAKPRMSLWKHALRYLVVGAAILVAYQLHVISLPATFAGLCSFVVAFFIEALREFYFAIFRREESV